jgi:hypothetical protein
MMPWEDEDRMVRALEAKGRSVCAGIVRAIGVPALAAAARQGGDVQQAPGEAPQSGGDSRNAQPLLPPSKDSDNHG